MESEVPPEWTTLANVIVERRTELGYPSREAFAEAAELSPRVLGDLENARRTNYDRVTLARLEQALEWPAGQIRRLLAEARRVTAPTFAVGVLSVEEAQRLLDGPLPPEVALLVRLAAPTSPLSAEDREALLLLVRAIVRPWADRYNI